VRLAARRDAWTQRRNNSAFTAAPAYAIAPGGWRVSACQSAGAMRPAPAAAAKARMNRLLPPRIARKRHQMRLLVGGVALLMLAACANLAGLLWRAALHAVGSSRCGRRWALDRCSSPASLAGDAVVAAAARAGLALSLSGSWRCWSGSGRRFAARCARVHRRLGGSGRALALPHALGAALAPALQAGRGDAREALATAVGSPASARARRVTVLLEVALTASC